jgi:hypothetical protein
MVAVNGSACQMLDIVPLSHHKVTRPTRQLQPESTCPCLTAQQARPGSHEGFPNAV